MLYSSLQYRNYAYTSFQRTDPVHSSLPPDDGLNSEKRQNSIFMFASLVHHTKTQGFSTTGATNPLQAFKATFSSKQLIVFK